MKVGFFGDSYCASSPMNDEEKTYHYSWPWTVAKLLKIEADNHCISGDTLWHTYLYLKESIENYDIVVICISDPLRQPNHYRIPTINTTFDDEVSMKRLNSDQIKEYTQYIKLHQVYRPQGYNLVAQIGVLTKLDELIGKHSTKALILPSFENSLQGYIFKNASVANINLNEGIKNKVKNKIPINKGGYPVIANHLQEKENNVLAKAVVDFINNDYKLEFNLKKYFNYLYN